MSAISPPFSRRKHVPSHCKRCGCFEFLDIRRTRTLSGEYSGEEVCLACPHRAWQHVWKMIEEKIDYSPPRNPDSPIFKRYEIEEQDQNSSPMWKYSARKAQQRALTEVKIRVIPLSPILPASPALLSTYRLEEKGAEELEAQEDLEEEPGEIEKEEEDKENEEVFEEGEIDIDISKFCSSPPPILSPELVIPSPIGGRVTLEKIYKYMVERNNYTDCLQKRILKKIEQNKTMLRRLSSDSLSAREEVKKIKGMVNEIAGDYRSERLDKRLKKVVTPEVVRGVREIGIMGVSVGIKSPQKARASPNRQNSRPTAGGDSETIETQSSEEIRFFHNNVSDISRGDELLSSSPQRSTSPTKIPLSSGGFKVISSSVTGTGYEMEETDEEEDFIHEETEEDTDGGGDEEMVADEEYEGGEMEFDRDEEEEDEEDDEGGNERKNGWEISGHTQEEEEGEEEEEEEEGEEVEVEAEEDEVEEDKAEEDEDKYTDPNQIYLNRYQNRPLVQLYSGSLPLMTPIKEETQYSSPRWSFELSSPAKAIISRQQMVSSRGKAPPEVNYPQMLPDEIGRYQLGSSPFQQQRSFADIEEGEEDEHQDQHGYEDEFEEEDTFFQDKYYSTSSIRPSDLDPQSPNVSSPQTMNAQSNKRRLENDVSKSRKTQAIETGPRSSKRQRLREVQENIGDAPGPTKYVEIATPSTDNGTRQNNGSNVLQGSYIPSHILNSSSPCESLSGQPLSDELQSPAITDKSSEVPEVSFVNTKTRNSRLSDGSGSSEQGAAIGEMQLLVEGARHKKIKKKSKRRKRAIAKMI